jgi:serine/threonine protein kinase
MKSPLNKKTEPEEIRQLHPAKINPHHIHSSPSVKESKKVSLGYDPVSRKKVLNSYEIIKELGRGEHGKVKLAKHLETGELVAIKIVDRKGPKRSFRPQASHEEKIRREIAIMKKINHPNVVQLKEVMDDENSRKIYLVLEYLEKGEVKWQKSPGVPLMSLDEALRVFRDVVLGLEYLHYQGIIHRDIKPANLLISKDGSVKISDFGVSFASSLKTGEQDDYDLAKTAGTPAFLAPELCQPIHDLNDTDHPQITYKIDIWALGVTLYCFLFGKLPFWANNEYELFDVICNNPLELPDPFPSGFTPEDKADVRNFMTKILDKDPSTRLTIREIKQHPLTLKNLTLEEAATFIEGQKSCEFKIKVSSEEVQVAVTGLGSKLRKGFAKALKFAGLASRGSSRYATNSLVINDSDSRVPSSATLSEAHTIPLDHGSSHRRVKSSDSASLTHTTVEGDLFLKKGSAFNSLNNIMDTDRRRSSVGSIGAAGMSSTATSESYNTTSADSSIGLASQLVSLPVNASFASLDSVYMDNYAPAYAYTNVSDARNPQHRDMVHRMSNFTLNRGVDEEKIDEAVPPHAKFDLGGSGSDDDDEEEDTTETDDDYGEDRISELSVPSYLVHEMISTSRRKSKSSSHRSSTLPQRGAPKYSFMDNSSDSGSEPEVIFANTSDEEEDEPLVPTPAKDVSTDVVHLHTAAPDSSLVESSSGEELTLSFGGNRQRHNTVTLPSTGPQDTPRKPSFIDRVSSPLAHNAPKTAIANSNAHLARNYVNHYHRVVPHMIQHPHHNDHRGRSNSITVGILDHEKDAHIS